MVEETEVRGEEQEAGGGGGGGRWRREAAVGARALGRRAGPGTRMEKQRAGEEEAGGSHIFWLALPSVSHQTASLRLLGTRRFAERRLAWLHQKPLEKPLDKPCQIGPKHACACSGRVAAPMPGDVAASSSCCLNIIT